MSSQCVCIIYILCNRKTLQSVEVNTNKYTEKYILENCNDLNH